MQSDGVKLDQVVTLFLASWELKKRILLFLTKSKICQKKLKIGKKNMQVLSIRVNFHGEMIWWLQGLQRVARNSMDYNHPRPALGKGGGSDKKEEELAAPGSGTTAESQVPVLPPRYRDRYRPAPKSLMYSPRYRSGTCHVLPLGRASTWSSRYYRWVSGTTAGSPVLPLPACSKGNIPCILSFHLPLYA